jgi:hypothetical protein
MAVNGTIILSGRSHIFAWGQNNLDTNLPCTVAIENELETLHWLRQTSTIQFQALALGQNSKIIALTSPSHLAVPVPYLRMEAHDLDHLELSIAICDRQGSILIALPQLQCIPNGAHDLRLVVST